MKLLKEWKLYAMLLTIGLFAVDVAGHLLNFPLRLVLLRVSVHLADWTWLRIRS